MVGRYVTPEYGVTPFTCPLCDTLAPQESGEGGLAALDMGTRIARYADSSMYLTYCTSCSKKSVWARHPDYRRIIERLSGRIPKSGPTDTLSTEPEDEPTVVSLVYPRRSDAPPPNVDLPEDVAEDYKEASSVLALSPRSSAALLRLCLQKLCKHFGQPGKNIDKEIGALVLAGTLRQMIQKAMDTVRITGNESVHPGELNVTDDKDLALALFEFINLIADEAITQPKKVDAMYERMPESKRNSVAQRDGTPPTGLRSPTS